MIMRKLSVLAFVTFAATASAACGKAEPASTPPAAESEKPAKPVAPVIQAYDDLREALALDDIGKAQAAAKKLSEVAASEYAKVAEQAKAAIAAADLKAMRTAFGEVSRALLGVIQEKPELGEGLFVYRCPMTETYQKWVQVTKTMRNPYMGQEMLECGSKAKPEP